MRGSTDDGPSVGKWWEQDPILFTAGDANVYRAMGNNVTNATDPSGLLTQQQIDNLRNIGAASNGYQSAQRLWAVSPQIAKQMSSIYNRLPGFDVFVHGFNRYIREREGRTQPPPLEGMAFPPASPDGGRWRVGDSMFGKPSKVQWDPPVGDLHPEDTGAALMFLIGGQANYDRMTDIYRRQGHSRAGLGQVGMAGVFVWLSPYSAPVAFDYGQAGLRQAISGEPVSPMISDGSRKRNSDRRAGGGGSICRRRPWFARLASVPLPAELGLENCSTNRVNYRTRSNA